MRPDELERLIQDRLDGVATPEEAARLSAVLERRPEAKVAYRRMERVFQTLEQVEQVEAPPDLATPALRAIEGRDLRREGTHRRFGREGRIGLVRLTFAFTAGAVVGLVSILALTTLHQSPFRGDPPLTGTVLPSWGGAGPIERKRLEFSAGEVMLESRRVPGGVVVAIDPAVVPVRRIVLDYDSNSMRWIGFRQRPEGGAVQGKVAWSPGRVVLEPEGPGPYVLEYAAGEDAGPLGIIVLAGDQALRASLRTSRGQPRRGG